MFAFASSPTTVPSSRDLSSIPFPPTFNRRFDPNTIMPEIGEVARIVKLLNQHVTEKVITSVVAHEDTIVFEDTTAAKFITALEGRTIKEAKQWGKYFW